MDEFYQNAFSRNLGILTAEQQQRLKTSTVGIAGAGGDGGLLAERLVRLGIGGIILADPEAFEESNLNRQYGADISTLSCNKAKTVAKNLLKINPELNISLFAEGLTQTNAAAFVEAADVVVDEIEYSRPDLSVLLNNECRVQDKYMFMGANTGWGCSIFCFSPDGISFTGYFEFDEHSGAINLQKYIPDTIGYIPADVVEGVFKGTLPVPSVAPAVALTAAMLSTQITFYLTKIQPPVIVPDILHIDLFNDTHKFIKQ